MDCEFTSSCRQPMFLEKLKPKKKKKLKKLKKEKKEKKKMEDWIERNYYRNITARVLSTTNTIFR